MWSALLDFKTTSNKDFLQPAWTRQSRGTWMLTDQVCPSQQTGQGIYETSPTSRSCWQEEGISSGFPSEEQETEVGKERKQKRERSRGKGRKLKSATQRKTVRTVCNLLWTPLLTKPTKTTKPTKMELGERMVQGQILSTWIFTCLISVDVLEIPLYKV